VQVSTGRYRIRKASWVVSATILPTEPGMDACPRADQTTNGMGGRDSFCVPRRAFWDGPIGLAFRADDSRQLAAPAERRAGRASDGSRPRAAAGTSRKNLAGSRRTRGRSPDPMIVADRYAGAELGKRTTLES
jgi:hypothetical protein